RCEGPARLFSQTRQRRFLGRPRKTLLQKPSQSSHLLAVTIFEEELRCLALLPPSRPGHSIQDCPAKCLPRHKDQTGKRPLRRTSFTSLTHWRFRSGGTTARTRN